MILACHPVLFLSWQPDYESVTLTREEFVCVIEGFVMDHEEESDDADDYRAPAQRRHLHTITGDVQEQVRKGRKDNRCVWSCVWYLRFCETDEEANGWTRYISSSSSCRRTLREFVRKLPV